MPEIEQPSIDQIIPELTPKQPTTHIKHILNIESFDELPSSQEILESPKLIQWLNDNSYNVLAENDLLINEELSKATMSITKIEDSITATLTINFIVRTTLSSISINAGSFDQHPTADELLKSDSIKNWIKENRLSNDNLVIEEFDDNATSTIMFVEETTYKKRGHITINFIVRTALTSTSAINIGSFDQKPTTNELLNLEPIFNWIQENKLIINNIKFETIEDGATSTIMIVEPTMHKLGARIKIDFIVRTEFIDPILTNTQTFIGVFPTTKEILETISFKEWINENEYLIPSEAKVMIKLNTSTALVKIASTPTKKGGMVTIKFTITKLAFPSSSNINNNYFDNSPTAEDILNSFNVNRWFLENKYQVPEPSDVVINGKMATIKINPTFTKEGGEIIINFSVRTALTSTTPIYVGEFLETPTPKMLLAKEPIQNWLRENFIFDKDVRILPIADGAKTTTMIVNKTSRKLGANITINFDITSTNDQN